MMNLTTWLEKIQKIHPIKWDLGLERVAAVGQKLEVLKPAKTTFLIAGTNGKGSTCEVLARLCSEAGLTYGKASSPFLLAFNEQIVVNGKAVSDEDIIASFERIDHAREAISLSYFEFSTLAALDIFKHQQVDVAILEVGLGGRLDAMNIVDVDVSIICKIDIDHRDWLGDDRESIAREKAGIMRAGKPCTLVDPDPPSTLFSELELKQALGQFLGRDFFFENNVLSIGDLDYLIPDCALPISSAIAAVHGFLSAGFSLSQESLTKALSAAMLPGRYQVIERPALNKGQALKTILDVAHNPNAAQYLFDKLQAEGVRSVQAVVAMYADKDIDQVFRILAPIVQDWHFPAIVHERAASVSELSERLSGNCGLQAKTYDKVASAYEAAAENCRNDDVVLVFGSFSVVAAVLRELKVDPINN